MAVPVAMLLPGDAQVLDVVLDEESRRLVPGNHLGAVVAHLPGAGGAGGILQQLAQHRPQVAGVGPDRRGILCY